MLKIYKEWHVSVDRHGFTIGEKYESGGKRKLVNKKHFNTIDQVLEYVIHIGIFEGSKTECWDDVIAELKEVRKEIASIRETLVKIWQ